MKAIAMKRLITFFRVAFAAVVGFAAEAAPGPDCTEAELIASLRAEPVEAGDACLHLLAKGTSECVPALAAALARERVAHAALNTLERLSSPEVGPALRSAWPTVHPSAKAALIAAIGRRGDAAAVPLLLPVLQQHSVDTPLATAAAKALGAIASAPAVKGIEEALSDARPSMTVALQAALLDAAERTSAAHDRAEAARLFGIVAERGVSTSLRLAGWRGLVLADESRRTERLVAAFNASDPELRRSAFKLLREVQDRPAVSGLRERWALLDPLQKLALLDAGAGLGADGVADVKRALADPEPDVRLAALRIASGVGNESFTSPLLRAAVAGSAREREAARIALARIPAPTVTTQLAARVEDAAAAEEKIEALRALGERGGDAARIALLRQAGNSDPAIANAAQRALLRMLDPETLSPLLRLALSSREDADRRALRRILIALCSGATDADRATRDVLAGLEPAPFEVAMPWFVLLPALSTPAAQARLETMARGDNRDRAIEAVRLFGDWRTPQPAASLLQLGRSNTDRELAAEARRSAIAVSARETDPARRVGLLEQVAPLAREADEKLLILAQLRRIAHPTAAKLASAFLNDPAVAENAATAVAEINAAASRPSP